MGDERKHERLESDQTLWTKGLLASVPMVGIFVGGTVSVFPGSLIFAYCLGDIVMKSILFNPKVPWFG